MATNLPEAGKNLPVTDGGFIPGEVMVDILLRIPSTSLLRLRSVCKSWSNLIIHPQFTANLINPQHMILFPGFDQVYSRKFVSLFQLKKSHQFTTLFEIDQTARRKRNYDATINFPDFFKEMVVAGSINGIICLSSYCTSRACSVVLWNPTINKWKPILYPFPLFKHVNSSIGFGYDSVNNDYKIIMIVSATWGSRIQLYSANHDAWVEINNAALFPFTAQNPNCSVIVKGVPYWTSNNKHEIHPDCEEVIGAFNPRTGLGKRIPYPVHIQNENTSVHLMNLMDSLAVLIYSPGENPNNIVDVYALDDTPGTWIKKFTVGLAHLPIRDNICIKQCFEEAGEIILVCRQENHDRTTFFYDPKTNCLLDSVASIGIDACHPMWDESYRHIESRVCIRGMQTLGDENEERTGSRGYIGRPIGPR